jgi:hypothetical protein
VAALTAAAPLPNTRSHCVLLSLRSLPAEEESRVRRCQFISITWRNLIREIRDRLGHHAAGGDAKFVTYLIDFMETIEQLSGGGAADRSRYQFFDRRAAEIENLHAEWQRYREQRLGSVRALLRQFPAAVARVWVYQKYTLVHDFSTLAPAAGKLVSVDFGRGAEHWWAVVWPRTADATWFQQQVLPKLGPGEESTDGRHHEHIPATASDEEVAGRLNRLLLAVASALGHPVDEAQAAVESVSGAA